MEVIERSVRDTSALTGIMQWEHSIKSIYFYDLQAFEGTVYLSLESKKYKNAGIEMQNGTFIIGQPMTRYSGTYKCQVYGILNNGEKIKLSRRFYLVVDESNDITGESYEYPIDPNLVNGIDEYITEVKEQAQSEIEATGDAVIESIPSDYTELEGRVDDLESDKVSTSDLNTVFKGIREISDESDNFVTGKYIRTSNAGDTIDLNTELDGTGATRILSYKIFDIHKGDTAIYDGYALTGGANRPLCFVTAEGVMLAGVAYSGNVHIEMTASQDCKCLINTVTWSQTLGNIPVSVTVIKNDTYADVLTDIADLDLRTKGLTTTNGWTHLPVENFSRNDWNSYNNASSTRNYRVRYNLPLQYSRDITLLASEGFYLSGYKSDGTGLGVSTTLDIPANTAFKVYIRRISENSGEMADIEEFANALNISTPLCDMERYKYTFTDVTMFPRIGISGDSFSAGGGIISGVRELTWGKNLERESGVIVDIYAKSGESIVGWNTDETNGLPALLAGEECGLYWFAHGINGTSSDSAIGTTEDMSANPKPQTFYGQYVYAIETIQRKFPQARIVIATIMGTGYGLYQTVYAKVNTAIRNIAEYCNVPIVDLASDVFYKSVWYDTHSLSNHPTAMLNAGIAHANRRILADTIMNNASYFIDYGDKYKYAVSCPPTTGGYVSASPSVVASGETVTLSNTAYPGYRFVGYTSDDVTITNGTFVMPSHKVTINCVFEEE